MFLSNRENEEISCCVQKTLNQFQKYPQFKPSRTMLIVLSVSHYLANVIAFLSLALFNNKKLMMVQIEYFEFSKIE